MQSKICTECGKIFYKKVNTSRKNWRLSKYCSLVCRYKPKGKIKICLSCGKEFYQPVSLLNTKYCSSKCYGKSKIGTENFFNPDKGHTVIYDCEECGKENKQVLAVYNKAKHHFCSSNCANIYNGKIHSKENHWNWKGGITEPNHAFRVSTPYKQWRLKVFQRDKFTCVKCGYRSKKPKDIVADHIKPFSLFPDLRLEVSNGRTLCIPCDKKYGYNFLTHKVKYA